MIDLLSQARTQTLRANALQHSDKIFQLPVAGYPIFKYCWVDRGNTSKSPFPRVKKKQPGQDSIHGPPACRDDTESPFFSLHPLLTFLTANYVLKDLDKTIFANSLLKINRC